VADPVTRSEAFVVTSANGSSWSAPMMVDPDSSESWFPWIDVAPTARLACSTTTGDPPTPCR
jgi:hypothetical protein